jgi:STE24 endopeptidase
MQLGFRAARAAVLFALAIFLASVPASAQPASAPTGTVAVHALPPAGAPQAFDALKATNAYLAQVSGPARAKSDAYFEGGYWLILIDALYAIVVSALLLWLKISARMRNTAERWTRFRFLQVPIYAVQYLILTAILTFPLDIYEGFLREHQYGLSNQNFLQWFRDFAVGNIVGLVAFTIVVTVIYAAIRRSKKYWWVWGTAIAIVFLMIGAMIAPVYIAPLFNKYESLKEGPLRTEILSVARSEGIPAKDVYVFDASKQTKRISANVSGFLGTTRISLNDNLLNRSHDQREIVAVLGHEMGHYVLDHSVRLIFFDGFLFLIGFGFVAWGFNGMVRMFGGSWDVRGIDDPAGLPVLMALMAFFMLAATPIQNTIVRTTEAQADIFGVNAVRQPDGFAQATLQLSEYRKLDPTPLEEFVFYDHPSGRSRIFMMMRWKAEHLNDPDIKAGPVSPQ